MDIDFLAGLPTGRGGTEVFQEVDVEVKNFTFAANISSSQKPPILSCTAPALKKKPFGIKSKILFQPCTKLATLWVTIWLTIDFWVFLKDTKRKGCKLAECSATKPVWKTPVWGMYSLAPWTYESIPWHNCHITKYWAYFPGNPVPNPFSAKIGKEDQNLESIWEFQKVGMVNPDIC